MTDPILFVIDDDPRERAAFERVLLRRYGADYRVMAERSPDARLDALERLAHRGEEVALVAADLRLHGETSMPGVFAVGDARHGSVKRVAGAVGEGSVAVGSVHQYLSESPAATVDGK